MKTIPFFDYSALYKRFEAEFDETFKSVCSRGAFILQSDLEQFEAELCDFLSVKHVFGVADGTNAMIIGLKAIGITSGDEVIISSHTYVATAAAIHLVGATPVFADIDDNNLLCAASAEAKLTPRTKAIMPTQLNGRCANMTAIRVLAEREGIHLLEDSAQGLGARHKGKAAGTFGAFGNLSFYPAKLIGCFGDGGAVMTDNDDTAEKLSLLRDHGRNDSGEVIAWGTNSRLDNLQAAFLRVRLKHFDEDIGRRREIAKKYNDAFKNNPYLFPPAGPDDNPDYFDVYQNYEIAVEFRDDLRENLAKKGVKTIIQWSGKPVHHFDNLGFGRNVIKDLPRTDWFFERCLLLPMHMGLQDDDVDYIIEKVLGFYHKKVSG